MASEQLQLRHRIVKSSARFSTVATPVITPRGDKYKQWLEGSMEKAYKAVVENKMSIRRAAEAYGVPKSTLQDRITGKVQFGTLSGKNRYLSDIEEMELVSFLMGCASIGYPKTVKQILSIVQNVVDHKGISCAITVGWWQSFQRRHPELSLRCAEPLSTSRAKVSTDVLHKYFSILEETLEENNILDQPCQIFNADETGMPLNPALPKVVVRKGVKHSQAITSANQSQITVLACCNAGGYCLPPFVIFDGKVLKAELTMGEVPGTFYGLSSSGWIDSELFELWFEQHFLAYAPPTRPLLLLLDGHSSHYNPRFIKKAAEADVIVFCLPPHATHRAQPLDKGPFGPLKSAWKQVCRDYLTKNPFKNITRFQFSSLFNDAWTRSMTMANVMAGFRVTGVYPVNRNAVISEEDCSITMKKDSNLKYIPLFSPVRGGGRRSVELIPLEQIPEGDSLLEFEGSTKDSFEDRSTCSSPDLDGSLSKFTAAEQALYEKRYEEGYNLVDDRYNSWLQVYHPSSSQLAAKSQISTKCQSLQHQTAFKRFIHTEQPRTKLPSIPTNQSCGRVLTSADNLKRIQQKENEKQEKETQKQLRQLEREKKRKEKEKERQDKEKLKQQKKEEKEKMERLKQQRKEEKEKERQEAWKKKNLQKKGDDEEGSCNSSQRGTGSNKEGGESLGKVDKRSYRSNRRGTSSNKEGGESSGEDEISLRSNRCGTGSNKEGGESLGKVDKRSCCSNRRGTSSNKEGGESLGLSSMCELGNCVHESAGNWVQCEKCLKWWHCICAGVKYQTARNKNFFCC